MTSFGPLQTRVVGDEQAQGGTVVVLFHGYGAPGDDLVPIARALDVDKSTRFIFPAAPHALQSGVDFSAFGMGAPRAWWHIDIAALEDALANGRQREFLTEVPSGMKEAREMACALLDEVEKKMAPTRIIVGGFSQGAMLATSITLETDRKIDGLIAWSGTYLCEQIWKPRMPLRAGLRTLHTHGTHDPLLPHALAEKLVHDMKEAGVNAEFVSFRGQHQIPPVALQRTEALLLG